MPAMVCGETGQPVDAMMLGLVHFFKPFSLVDASRGIVAVMLPRPPRPDERYSWILSSSAQTQSEKTYHCPCLGQPLLIRSNMSCFFFIQGAWRCGRNCENIAPTATSGGKFLGIE